MVTRRDAGETGCGQLVVELRRRVEALGPGEHLEVVGHDPGAPTDLPAWCRMTGHPKGLRQRVPTAEASLRSMIA